MSDVMAVLSYTRKDNEFFGGYITSFRMTLESALHVVTGRETFRIFQDVEGIVIGEQWQKKLADVIDAANFLVPMVSPLFFNSRPCREEVELFLAHERELGRDDLILPVYFVSSAKLEKEEEKARDPLALELGKRQMFDWREKANVPLQEPAARTAILALASAVAAAIERQPPPQARAVSAPAIPRPGRSHAVDDRVTGIRGHMMAGPAGPERVVTRELMDEVDQAALPANGDPVPFEKREKPAERVILWVDDNPTNNVWERRALEAYGVRFVLAVDTKQAEGLLRDGEFAAIISDMGRPGDPRAGYTLLGLVRGAGIETPYFIYAGSRSPEHVRAAIESGAQGATNDPDELVAMVVAAFR